MKEARRYYAKWKKPETEEDLLISVKYPPKKRWKDASTMRNWVQIPRAPHKRLSIAAHIVILAMGRWRQVIIRDLLDSSSNWTSELEAQWEIVTQKLRGRSHSGRYPTWIAGFHTHVLMCMHSHTHKCHTRLKKGGGLMAQKIKELTVNLVTWVWSLRLHGRKRDPIIVSCPLSPHKHAMAQGMVGF